MQGTGVALVTPFTTGGDVDEAALTALVGELETDGVDFIVPAGSTGEAPLLSLDEQARVVSLVADASTVPVLAGTGQPGWRGTERATVRAAAAGADAAMVVTPYYYDHDQATLTAHYRDLADAVDLPVYAYSAPSKTGVAVEPETAAQLASHPNLVGMKDSSGDLDQLQRSVAATADEPFELLIGHGGLFAHALEMGAVGGVLSLANVAPGLVSEVFDRHDGGDDEGARRLNRELIELNRAVTAQFGVPGLKAAMRLLGLPAGYSRAPYRPVGPEVEADLEGLLEAVGLVP